MILSDRDIRKEVKAGRVVIEPFDAEMVQPSSIDLHVDDTFRIFANSRYPYIDVKKRMDDLTEEVKAGSGEPFILHPGEFVLGSTLEKVSLPDDIVARIEGKSSLGRLGLLIHSSLPGSERVWILEGGRLAPRSIGEVVAKRVEGSVVGFDPKTMEVGYHPITDWVEGPPDRIFEVVLESGRRIRVTGGHSLFTLNRAGSLLRVRPLELRRGDRVAIPRRIPDPPHTSEEIELLPLVPEADWRSLVLQGPTISQAFDSDPSDVYRLLKEEGFRHVGFYRSRARLPLHVAKQIRGLISRLGEEDRLGVRGSPHTIPLKVAIDSEVAWLLGLYLAEGYRRRNQVTIANTQSEILDRAERALMSMGLTVYRNGLHLTTCSTIFSSFLDWIGAGGKARQKAIPPVVLGWRRPLLEAFLEGLLDGDGSREASRNSLWSSSRNLVTGMLLLAPRLGLRASATSRERDGGLAFQVSIPHREYKLLTAIPLPSELLIEIRSETGLSQTDAAGLMGFKRSTDLNNLERRSGRSAARRLTLQRVRDGYASLSPQPPSLPLLTKLVDGAVAWDRVAKVVDTGVIEPVYDLEVRPGGRAIENFLAGDGGVFASNTAGFVDSGWSGHLTLELSNVANLPITIYPGMKIGQLCLFRMSSPAERPYSDRGKYQDQRGPTPSRFYEDFERET